MNIVKLQDIRSTHRNPLHSYTLTMRKQKEIKETVPFTATTKRVKYLGIFYIKKQKTYIEKTLKTGERNQRGHK